MTKNLTPEQIEQRKNTNKKILKFFILPVIGLLVFIGVITSVGEDNGNETTPPAATKVIPGLMPADVYLNLEKQGFTTEKQFSSEYGNTWISKKEVEGISFVVTTYSSETENVENVKATATIDSSVKEIVATESFIGYIASLPFENSKPKETMQWVKDNFNNDKASTTVGSVKFTIYAPTEVVRMIIVEKQI